MAFSWHDLPAPSIGRRTALTGGVAALTVPALALASTRGGPSLIRRRSNLVTGARCGEVTTDSALLWSRAERPGRLHAEVRSGRDHRLLRGPATDASTDLTARLPLSGLRPGRTYEARLWFEHGPREESEPTTLTFATAPVHAAAQSVIWSGDINGQGWGIDTNRGGMATYRTMLDLRPDLFLHVGDTIYADEPMAESRIVDDGSTWVNLLTPEMTKVAETLEEFRARHRYSLLDEHVRAFHAQVPSVVQWDDHETCNNWWPGEVLDDDRYTERRVDVLAVRGRRAFEEYQPVPVRRIASGDVDGFVPTRLYRRVPRGRHLDVFCLDMRSLRAPNLRNDPDYARDGVAEGVLGREQEAWLIEALRRSSATWKVISADQPLSAPSTRVTDLDGPANGDDGPPLGREPEIARILAAIKAHDVRNVIWVTTDVHYTAAHHYAPERAAFTDFTPFWEFVSGPLHSSPFWTKDADLDATFGPRVEFSKGEDTTRLDVTPTPDKQYFGHLAISAAGELTVTLYDALATPLWQRTLEPDTSR